MKDLFYEQFARVGKVVASPRRVELLDLLAQGERTVEGLAALTGMGVPNTSSHLQVLRQARLVEVRKQGTKVFYRLAGESVVRFLLALVETAKSQLAEVDAVMRDHLADPDGFEAVGRDQLLARAQRGEVTILDVRPTDEYLAGHIPGAVSLPLEELEARLSELGEETEIVAYCRGSLCVLAPEAVRLLRAHGFRARRLEDGLPEWRLAGLPVAVGQA